MIILLNVWGIEMASSGQHHIWKNIDIGGTRGWFKCTRCGHKQNFPKVVSGSLPLGDVKVFYPPMSCDEMIMFTATQLIEKINKLFVKCDTYEIRQMVKKLLS